MSRTRIFVVTIPKDWIPTEKEVKEIYDDYQMNESGYSFKEAYADVLNNIDDLKSGISFTNFGDDHQGDQASIINVLCYNNKFVLEDDETSSHCYGMIYGVSQKEIEEIFCRNINIDNEVKFLMEES